MREREKASARAKKKKSRGRGRKRDSGDSLPPHYTVCSSISRRRRRRTTSPPAPHSATFSLKTTAAQARVRMDICDNTHSIPQGIIRQPHHNYLYCAIPLAPIWMGIHIRGGAPARRNFTMHAFRSYIYCRRARIFDSASGFGFLMGCAGRRELNCDCEGALYWRISRPACNAIFRFVLRFFPEMTVALRKVFFFFANNGGLETLQVRERFCCAERAPPALHCACAALLSAALGRARRDLLFIAGAELQGLKFGGRVP